VLSWAERWQLEIETAGTGDPLLFFTIPEDPCKSAANPLLFRCSFAAE
jgi:hypothetical protein